MFACSLAYGQKVDQGVFVEGQGRIDYNNSTTNLLLANTSYTGTATDVSSYSAIALTCFADVNSDVGGLQVHFSDDAVDWHNGEDYTVISNSTKFYTPPVQARYYRLVYYNNGLDQTDFHLHSMLKKYPIKWSSHNINDPIVAQDDATLTKTVLTALKPDGVFGNINASVSGNLLTTDAENGLAISKGEVTGSTYIHKFGNAPDFDDGDGEVTIWDGADDASVDQMQYVFSDTNDIDSIISTSTADGQDVEIQGLDVNWALTNQTVTLTGQTRVAIPTALRRVFRMKNVGTSNLAGIVSCYVTNAPTVAGVVTDSTLVRSVVNNGNNQTLMAVYSVPASTTGYLRSFFASTAGANKASNYKVRLKARPFGQVFQVKHVTALAQNGTSHFQHVYDEPEVYAEKTDIVITVETTASPITASDIAAGFDLVIVDN